MYGYTADPRVRANRRDDVRHREPLWEALVPGRRASRELARADDRGARACSSDEQRSAEHAMLHVSLSHDRDRAAEKRFVNVVLT